MISPPIQSVDSMQKTLSPHRDESVTLPRYHPACFAQCKATRFTSGRLAHRPDRRLAAPLTLGLRSLLLGAMPRSEIGSGANSAGFVRARLSVCGPTSLVTRRSRTFSPSQPLAYWITFIIHGIADLVKARRTDAPIFWGPRGLLNRCREDDYAAVDLCLSLCFDCVWVCAAARTPAPDERYFVWSKGPQSDQAQRVDTQRSNQC